METTAGKQKKANTGLIVAGVIAAASSFVLLNSNARKKVKDTSRNMKDSVSKYATTIKKDPKQIKNAMITRVRNTTEISKDRINKVQTILDTQIKDMKKSTKNMVGELKEAMSSVKVGQADSADVKGSSVGEKDPLLAKVDDVKNKVDSIRKMVPETITDEEAIKNPAN